MEGEELEDLELIVNCHKCQSYAALVGAHPMGNTIKRFTDTPIAVVVSNERRASYCISRNEIPRHRQEKAVYPGQGECTN